MNPLQNRSSRAINFGLAMLSLALLGSGAQAQITDAQKSAIRGNCRSDFMSKCSGVTPGGKEALQCLQKNVESLSPGCKTAVSATIPAPAPAPVEAKPAQASPAPAAPAVAAPAPAAAPQTPPQPTVTAAPAPRAKVEQAVKPAAAPKQPASPPPKQAIAAPAPAAPPPAAAAAAPPMPTEAQMKAITFTCKREFSRFCKDVVKGGAQQVACLQANTAKLSPDCKTSLADLGDAMPAPAVAPPPPEAVTPKTPLVMTAVIGRSCLRDLIKHCRGSGVGDGEKMACLEMHADDLTVLCKAAMKVTTPLH